MLLAMFSMAAVAVVIILWFIAVYNRLVRLRNLKDEGWSGIDIQLKRRANLVPNLVESVKGYVGHERGVLEEVTRQRTRSLTADSFDERMTAESALSAGLDRLFVTVENYPALKASRHFLDLQNKLAELEEQIQYARRYYNGTVRNLNIGLEVFPNVIVAMCFKFQKATFFVLQEAGERSAYKVNFTDEQEGEYAGEKTDF